MTGTILLIVRLLLAASLYGFIGWAFFQLWKDIQQQKLLLEARQPPALSLEQVEPQPGFPQRFALQEVLIGRSPASTLVIDDSTVSARHARLVYRQGQWWLEDLNSTNGTFLNEDPVSTATVITQGDRLRCGQVAFLITISNKGESL